MGRCKSFKQQEIIQLSMPIIEENCSLVVNCIKSRKLHIPDMTFSLKGRWAIMHQSVFFCLSWWKMQFHQILLMGLHWTNVYSVRIFPFNVPMYSFFPISSNSFGTKQPFSDFVVMLNLGLINTRKQGMQGWEYIQKIKTSLHHFCPCISTSHLQTCY